MSDKCTSCGKDFIDHMGIIGTCKELQEVKAENKRLREALEIILEICSQRNVQSTVQQEVFLISREALQAEAKQQEAGE